MKRAIIIIISVLVFIGIAYYFLIYRKEKEIQRSTINGGTNVGTNGNDIQGFYPGDVVYLAADKGSWVQNYGIPVYRQPIADSIGSFLEGVTRGDWYAGQPIGKVVEVIPGWIKVNVNNLQIWRFIVNVGYTNQIAKLTGDYWISDKALYKI